MSKFKILNPEDAAKRAKANVEAFKREQARKAAVGRRTAPAVETANANPLSESKNKELNDLLLDRAKKGNKEEVDRLLKAGADVDAKDTKERTALMRASAYGHKEVVEVLVGKGANVHAKDNTGWTALMLAVGKGHTEIAELLKAHGATE